MLLLLVDRQDNDDDDNISDDHSEQPIIAPTEYIPLEPTVQTILERNYMK